MEKLLNGSLFSLDPMWWSILDWNREKKRITLSENDWRERVRLLRTLGMDTIILQFAVAEGKSFYPSALFPPAFGDEVDRFAAILDEASRHGLDVYLPMGSLAPSYRATNDITDMGRLNGTESLVAELYDRYGGMPSFAGWFIAEEPQKGLHEGREYLSAVCRLAHRLTPGKPVICAPHILNDGIDDTKLLRGLGFDILWTQVMAERCTSTGALWRNGEPWPERLSRIQRVKEACDRAGIRFWAEYEIFDFGERREYLLPAGIERLQTQLPSLSRRTEKIVVCGVPGLMEDPGFRRPLGSERAFKLFQDYRADGSQDAVSL